MLKQDFIRALLFVIFAGVGVASLGGAILCEDLLAYYNNKTLLETIQLSAGRLESLNDDYDALLRHLEKDPNAVKRIAPATLGVDIGGDDANTIYPRATAEQLAAAKFALAENSKKTSTPTIPEWIIRCCESRRRMAIFLSGAFLILISFICFGPAKSLGRKKS